MKIYLIALIAILLSACSNEPTIGHYTFADGRSWIDVETKAGVGSQLIVARGLFQKEAMSICKGKEYKESEVIETTQPSGRLPPGGLLDEMMSQIAKRSGFIVCVDGNE